MAFLRTRPKVRAGTLRRNPAARWARRQLWYRAVGSLDAGSLDLVADLVAVWAVACPAGAAEANAGAAVSVMRPVRLAARMPWAACLLFPNIEVPFPERRRFRTGTVSCSVTVVTGFPGPPLSNLTWRSDYVWWLMESGSMRRGGAPGARARYADNGRAWAVRGRVYADR